MSNRIVAGVAGAALALGILVGAAGAVVIQDRTTPGMGGSMMGGSMMGGSMMGGSMMGGSMMGGSMMGAGMDAMHDQYHGTGR